jgi:sortase A
MKSKLGIVCIILGVVLISGALFLALYNMHEENTAQEAVVSIMPQLMEKIETNKGIAPTDPENGATPDLELKIPVELLTEEDKKMAEIEIDGYPYIGYLSMPTLEKELPIMSTWSYPQLKIAPCRYSGSLRGEDLVLMAHNYVSHFGPIHRLEIGDPVIFTDVYGNVTEYEVVGKDILDPSAVDAMTAGDFDLTLFTCTYGGSSRVTVYCELVRS